MWMFLFMGCAVGMLHRNFFKDHPMLKLLFLCEWPYSGEGVRPFLDRLFYYGAAIHSSETVVLNTDAAR